MATALNSQPAAAAEPTPDVVDIRPRRSKRAIMLPIVGLLALLAIFYFGKRWVYGRAHESTDNAQVDADLVPVLARVGGYVSAVNIAENRPVKAGDVAI